MAGIRPKLSERLTGIADCVRAVSARFAAPPRLLDVGCDHGLVPVDLLITGDIESATASDLNEGPLAAARTNAERYGVEKRLRLVCTDGLKEIGEDCAEICVIAGMGGELIRDILAEGDAGACGIQYLVLSPHTKADILRKFLRDAGYRLISEMLSEEQGKTYPVLTLSVPPSGNADPAGVFGKTDCYEICIAALSKACGCTAARALQVACAFGPVLLAREDRALFRYLSAQRKRLLAILEQMPRDGADAETVRRAARDVEIALSVFGETANAPERRRDAVQ